MNKINKKAAALEVLRLETCKREKTSTACAWCLLGSAGDHGPRREPAHPRLRGRQPRSEQRRLNFLGQLYRETRA